jgi:hypothetical protein
MHFGVVITTYFGYGLTVTQYLWMCIKSIPATNQYQRIILIRKDVPVYSIPWQIVIFCGSKKKMFMCQRAYPDKTYQNRFSSFGFQGLFNYCAEIVLGYGHK